jgi:hypothetical protein
MIKQQRYLWIRNGHDMIIVDDLKELLTGNRYDEENDKIYVLGEQVKIEVSIKPVTKVFRNSKTDCEDS